MSKTQTILAYNLRRLIEKKEISQAELGRQTGYSAPAVSSWLMTDEKAKMPSPETIDKICLYFCISPAQLLTEHEEITPGSYSEKLLLDTFRQLNEVNKGASLQMMQGLLSAQKKAAEAV